MHLLGFQDLDYFLSPEWKVPSAARRTVCALLCMAAPALVPEAPAVQQEISEQICLNLDVTRKPVGRAPVPAVSRTCLQVVAKYTALHQSHPIVGPMQTCRFLLYTSGEAAQHASLCGGAHTCVCR